MNDAQWRRLALPKRSHFIWMAIAISLFLIAKQAVVVCFLNALDPDIRDSLRVEFAFELIIAALCCILVGACGLTRLRRFPRRTSAYGQWLMRTAWTADQRLPFGPWTPIREDLVILIALSTLIALTAKPVLCLAPWVTYVVLWWLAGLQSGLIRHATCTYSFTITLPILIHLCLADSPLAGYISTAMLGFTVIVSLLGLRGLRQDLKKLPQTGFDEDSSASNGASIKGSIHDVLHREPQFGTGWKLWEVTAIAVPLFLWLTLPVWHSIRDRWLVLAIYVLLVLVTVFVRLAVFGCTAVSFGIPARWSMRRLILPKHDVAYVAPALMLISGTATGFLAFHRFLPPRIAYPLGIVIAVVIGLNCGPNLRDWSLTAPARLQRISRPRPSGMQR